MPAPTSAHGSEPSSAPLADPEATLPGGGAGAATAGALQPRTHVDRYIVLDRLGAGAMGVVHAAYDPRLDRRIALKLVPRGASAAMTALAAEARTLARLDHRGIVTVHDVGELDDGLFIAMEYLDGVTLRERLRARPHWREVVPLFAAAADALAAAHRAGVVHGDFKPDNVMVGGTDAEPARVTVLDFGLARLERAETEPGDAIAVRGTPAYVSPEQLAGRPPDARSDQFSFCVALFEALCGVRPFAAATFASAALAFRERPVPAFPDRAAIPGWLRALVLRGLAIDPTQRWPSMDALAAGLERGPRRGRRRALAVAMLGLAALGVGLGVAEQRRCLDADAEVHALWDASARDEIGARVGRELADLPADVWQRVAERMDGYVARTAGAMLAACDARGGEPATIAARRARCVDREVATVRGVVAMLRDGDGAELRRALSMVPRLGLADCTDAEELLQFPPASDDPERRERIAELEAELVRASSSTMLGDLAAREQELDEIVAAATELDERSLVATALLVRSEMTSTHRGPDQAYKYVERGLVAAEDSGIELLRVRAWLQLVGNRLAAHRDGELVDLAFAQVEAALPQLPEGSEVPVNLELHRGYRAYLAKDYATASEHFDVSIAHARAQGVMERALPAMQLRIYARLLAKRFEGLDELATELVELREREYGADHPETALARATAAIVYTELGDVDRGIADLDASLRTLDAWGGRELASGMKTACNFCRVVWRACRLDRTSTVCADCLSRSLAVGDRDAPSLWGAQAQALGALIEVDAERGRVFAVEIAASAAKIRTPSADQVATVALLLLADVGDVERALPDARELLARATDPDAVVPAAIVVAEHDPSSDERDAARRRMAGAVEDIDSDDAYLFARARLLMGAADPTGLSLDRARIAKAVAAACSPELKAAWAALVGAGDSPFRR